MLNHNCISYLDRISKYFNIPNFKRETLTPDMFDTLVYQHDVFTNGEDYYAWAGNRSLLNKNMIPLRWKYISTDLPNVNDVIILPPPDSRIIKPRDVIQNNNNIAVISNYNNVAFYNNYSEISNLCNSFDGIEIFGYFQNKNIVSDFFGDIKKIIFNSALHNKIIGYENIMSEEQFLQNQLHVFSPRLVHYNTFLTYYFALSSGVNLFILFPNLELTKKFQLFSEYFLIEKTSLSIYKLSLRDDRRRFNLQAVQDYTHSFLNNKPIPIFNNWQEYFNYFGEQI